MNPLPNKQQKHMCKEIYNFVHTGMEVWSDVVILVDISIKTKHNKPGR